MLGNLAENLADNLSDSLSDSLSKNLSRCNRTYKLISIYMINQCNILTMAITIMVKNYEDDDCYDRDVDNDE